MYLKNLAFSGLALLVISLIACHTAKHGKAAKAMPGTWQAQPIDIDGDSKDWPSPYPNYDSKAKVAYATSNDDKNLYITMETGDELTQIKILKNGMTVSIDTGGNKSPQYNITYPLQNDNQIFDMPKAENRQKKNEPAELTNKQFGKKIRKSTGDATQLALDGFANCSGGFLVTQTTPCGVKVKLGIDEYNELIWEASIPLSVLYGTYYKPTTDASKTISVCFALKGLKKPSTKGNDAPATTPGMSSGMGGARGGAMKGGGGGQRSAPENPLQQLYESTKTWKHFGLVGKP